MAIITGLTAARMAAIEAASVISGYISGNNLILQKQDGSTINAGNVRGPQGPTTRYIGELIPIAGITIPPQCLLCDGSAVSRTTYAALYSEIGTAYGSGNGTTTFNVPNAKGRVLVTKDPGQTEFDVVGETGGAKTHTLTVGQLPKHNHHYVTGWGSGSKFLSQGAPNMAEYGVGNGVFDLFEENGATPAGGTSQPHNNLQPYLTTNMVIYAGA